MKRSQCCGLAPQTLIVPLIPMNNPMPRGTQVRVAVRELGPAEALLYFDARFTTLP